MIGDVREAFDDADLADERARELVARQLDAFATWIERVRVREAALG